MALRLSASFTLLLLKHRPCSAVTLRYFSMCLTVTHCTLLQIHQTGWNWYPQNVWVCLDLSFWTFLQASHPHLSKPSYCWLLSCHRPKWLRSPSCHLFPLHKHSSYVLCKFIPNETIMPVPVSPGLFKTVTRHIHFHNPLVDWWAHSWGHADRLFLHPSSVKLGSPVPHFVTAPSHSSCLLWVNP